MEALSKRLKSIKQENLKLDNSIIRLQNEIFRCEQTLRKRKLKLKLFRAEYGI